MEQYLFDFDKTPRDKGRAPYFRMSVTDVKSEIWTNFISVFRVLVALPVFLCNFFILFWEFRRNCSNQGTLGFY